MDEKAGAMDGRGADGPKRFNSFRWLLILGLIGVAIMLFNSFVNVKKVDPENVGREPPGVMKNEPALQTTGGGKFLCRN